MYAIYNVVQNKCHLHVIHVGMNLGTNNKGNRLGRQELMF